jgi:hypothetical protein
VRPVLSVQTLVPSGWSVHLETTSKRSGLEADANSMRLPWISKTAQSGVPLDHKVAPFLGTRIGIGSYNSRENGSDRTFKAEIPSLGPMLWFLCAGWQAE